MKTLPILIFGLITISAIGQSSRAGIDSLNKEAQHRLRNPSEAIILADSAYQLARSQNYIKGLATSAKLKGIALYYTGQPDSALNLYQQSLAFFQKLNDTLETGKLKLNIATYHNQKADYASSIQWGLEALKQFELKNDRNGIGRVYNLIGQSYFFQGDYKQSAIYFQRHLANSLAVGDSVEIASSWTNLGSTYIDLDRTDSAIYFLKKAVALKERLQFMGNIGTAYMGLGTLYSKVQNFSLAAFNYEKALQYYQQVKDSSRIAELYIAMGQLQFNYHNLHEAERLVLLGLSVASRMQSKEALKSGYEMLTTIYEQRGDYKKAFEASRQYNEVSFAILNESNLQSLNLARIKFETEKKEIQLTKQQLLLTQSRWLIGFLSTTVLLILGLVIFWIRQNKSNQQRQLVLKEKEHQTLLTQAVISSQERERARFAKDLHDGLGQQISAVKLFASRSSDAWAHQVRNSLDQLHLEIRHIAFALLPNTLVNEGLNSALSELAERISSSKMVTVKVQGIGTEERLERTMEVSIYRVCQEWINNILKHGKTENILIELIRHEHNLTLIIEDDGPGFDAELLYQSNGLGWKNIESRVQLHKGTVRIETMKGKIGNVLIADIPLPPFQVLQVA